MNLETVAGIALFVVTILLARFLAFEIMLYSDLFIREGVKPIKKQILRQSVGMHLSKLKKIIKNYEPVNRYFEAKYKKMGDKLKKSGYREKTNVYTYIFIKYGFSAAVFCAGIINMKTGVLKSAVNVAIWVMVVEVYLLAKRKKINLIFQKNVYKIYKYLSNQISSGVRATDAIKSLHEVISDYWLKCILIETAAQYELTYDIDKSLSFLRDSLTANEADTLCIALKQGVETGDNSNILNKQEEVMFNKYFAYIQSETDKTKIKIALAGVFFTAVLVLMLLIPIFIDFEEAIGKIFMS